MKNYNVLREKIKLLAVRDNFKSELLQLTYEHEGAVKKEMRLRLLIKKLLNKIEPVIERYRKQTKVSYRELDELATRQLDVVDALTDLDFYGK